MLPKKRRIARAEFEHILKSGRRFNSPHLLLYKADLGSDNDRAPSRFSFSISKKIYKHAVDRNLYRRRGYSIVTPLLPRISPGSLFFFSFKKATATNRYPISFDTLQSEVLYLLDQARVLS